MIDQKYKLCPFQVEKIHSKMDAIVEEVKKISEFIGPDLSPKIEKFLIYSPYYLNSLNKSMNLYIEFYNNKMNESFTNKLISYVPLNTYCELDDNAKFLASFTFLKWRGFLNSFKESDLVDFDLIFSRNSEQMIDVSKGIYGEFFKCTSKSVDYNNFKQLNYVVKKSESLFNFSSIKNQYNALLQQVENMDKKTSPHICPQDLNSLLQSDEYLCFKTSCKKNIKEIEAEIMRSTKKVTESCIYIKENLLEIEELFDENVFSKFPKNYKANDDNCEFKNILEANGIL